MNSVRPPSAVEQLHFRKLPLSPALPADFCQDVQRRVENDGRYRRAAELRAAPPETCRARSLRVAWLSRTEELRCSCAETAPGLHTPPAMGCPEIRACVFGVLFAETLTLFARVLTGDLRFARPICGPQPRISGHVCMHAFQPQIWRDAALRPDLECASSRCSL